MWRFVVLLTCAVLTEAGVIQPSYAVQLSYPSASHKVVLIPTSSNNRVEEHIPEKSVSYSISYKDYLYLQHHKTHEKDSSNSESQIEEHNHDINQNSHKNIEVNNLDILKRSSFNNIINGGATVFNTPIVTKNIYFHIPPPEIEEQPVSIVVPPKKKYNIIFIKVPSQEPNNGQIHRLLDRIPPVEDKTLIYVLSKTPETHPPVIVPPKPISPPEVYYVKYKVNSQDVKKINNEIDKTSFLHNS